MKVYTIAALPFLMLTLVPGQECKAGVELNPSPLAKQGRLVEFANFFNNNLAGKIFISSNKDRPYQDKVVDYEYDVSAVGNAKLITAFGY